MYSTPKSVRPSPPICLLAFTAAIGGSAFFAPQHTHFQWIVALTAFTLVDFFLLIDTSPQHCKGKVILFIKKCTTLRIVHS